MMQRTFILTLCTLILNVAIANETTSNLNVVMTAQSLQQHPTDTTKTNKLTAGISSQFSLKITGKYDDGVVAGLHPAAWIRPRLNDRSSCKDAVRNYLQLGPNATQDIDLNSYNFITLNQDNSIGIMDPRLNLATANLLALKNLDETVTAWYLNSARGEIFVTQANAKKVSVINALNGKLLVDIVLESAPKAMFADEKQALLWVTSEDALLVIDLKTHKVLKSIPMSAENLLVTLSEDKQSIWTYQPKDGKLSAINTISFKTLWTRQLPKQLVSMTYSHQADRLYFANSKAKEIITIYPQVSSKISTIKLIMTPEKLQLTSDGNWLFSLDLSQKQLLIIETAVNRPKHHLVFKNTFDQVVFSDLYAYVHHTNSPKASLIQLDTLPYSETPSLIEVPFGVKAPDKQSNNFPAIVPFPEGGAVVASNAADKTLFIYMEDGMQAPANAFKIYTAPPKTLLIHNKSLTETQSGIYEAVTLIPRPGKYEMVFYLDSPLLVSCFPFVVEGDGKNAKSSFQSPVYDIQLLSKQYQSGQASEVKIKLLTETPIKNASIQLLFFKPGSNWQKRITVTQNKDMEYSASVVFPKVGSYLLAVESETLKLKFNQKKIKTIEVRQ